MLPQKRYNTNSLKVSSTIVSWSVFLGTSFLLWYSNLTIQSVWYIVWCNKRPPSSTKIVMTAETCLDSHMVLPFSRHAWHRAPGIEVEQQCLLSTSLQTVFQNANVESYFCIKLYQVPVLLLLISSFGTFACLFHGLHCVRFLKGD